MAGEATISSTTDATGIEKILDAREPAAPAAEESPVHARSLRWLAIRGSVWTIAGYGASQVMRLGGNVIVARLLFPEAFGIMGLVFAVMTGLAMFSDIGLGPSVIQHRRGEDPAFLRTAWTLQVLRGLAMWLLCIPLAWPLYRINHSPVFLWLIPIAGLTMVLSSFNSMSLFICRRRIDLKRVTLLTVAANAAGTIAMVLLALAWRSVAALLAHGFVSTTVILAGSYWYLPKAPAGFELEKEATGDLFRFGRWILFSTALTFLTARLDMFILSSFAGLTVLGLYNVAKNYSTAALESLTAVTSSVLFPVYSRLARDEMAALRRKTLWARAALLAIFLPAVWTLAIGARPLVNFLYDHRYEDAGWMLQLLAAGSVGAVIAATMDQVLLAQGDSFRYMLQLATRLSLQITGMAIGFWVAGIKGFIIGMALADILNYPVLGLSIRKYGVWLPWMDAAAYCCSALVIGTGWYMVR